MVQSVESMYGRTFLNGEAAQIPAHRMVKLKSGTTTEPAEIVYSDAGEAAIGVTIDYAETGERVAVKLWSDGGTFLIEAADTFNRLATLYSANDGKCSDSSSGTSILQAADACTAAGDIIECIVNPPAATTAATISIADTGAFTSAETVEAALAEIYQHIKSAQATISIPLGSLTQEDGTAITVFSDGDSAVAGFAQLSNKEQVLRWNNHATPGEVGFSVTLPEDLNDAAALVIHWLAAVSGATDTPEITCQAFFGAGDTDCAGTDDEIDGATTVTEYTCTIAHGDVPAGPTQLTVLFNPKDGELGTDDCYIYGVWIEYTRTILTA